MLIVDCTGCSRTGGRRGGRNRADQQAEPTETVAMNDSGAIFMDSVAVEPPKTTVEVTGNGKNEIGLEEDGGVYKIPVLVNGVSMKFILDTGASLISISELEAQFMVKQGTIGDADILGKSEFSDANGDISEGTIINLRSVQIGNRTLHNVRASVVSGGKAPLLLGQSALAQFGKVSLDYSRKTVSFD